MLEINTYHSASIVLATSRFTPTKTIRTESSNELLVSGATDVQENKFEMKIQAIVKGFAKWSEY